ncbi:type II secretion system protein [Duganella phyllosphaerae]|uniref:Fimbrial protein n=1 Tax=Duganella phyllosphaerae TaxID=762836 RepID=A0A1E7X894_9BURK|nr:type II secretion system protein [Duganella phyllosphaerae]OFA09172.1 fimbrial protein precursor [Duganella phyllosphaerae]
MNKQAMSVTRARGAQSGFTLIELIVVIVILGILAAVALPRFSNLSGDARVASLNAVRGSLASTAATAHGAWLVNRADPTFEGTTVNMDANGYALANANLVTAAGLDANDYTAIIAGGTAIAAVPNVSPAVPANSVAIVPRGIANSATAVTCVVIYTQSLGLNLPPVLSPMPTAANCR